MGDLLSAGGRWISGIAGGFGWAATYSASDPAGVCRIGIVLDGKTWLSSHRTAPDRTKVVQCPGRASYSDPIDIHPYEGWHTFQVWATNPADMTATQVGTARVGIDNEPPTIQLTGPDPGRWWSGPQTVTATAADQPGLSGVAYIEYSVDGSSFTPVSGATASIPVSGTGEHTIRAVAVDTAGNTSARTSYQVLIDQTPPTGYWLPINWTTDPRHIVLEASDAQSGLAGGQLALRWPDGTFHNIATTVDVRDGRLMGFVNDDKLADGDYQVFGYIHDAVGNQSTITSQADGSPLIVPIPLRTPTQVNAGTATALVTRCDVHRVMLRPVAPGQRPRARLVRTCRRLRIPSRGGTLFLDYGQRGVIEGILRTSSGQPIPGAPVTVVQRVPSWRSRPVAVLRTRRDGRFLYTFRFGPSRTLQFEFPGTPTLHDSSTTARVAVRGAGTLAISARRVVAGHVVVFSGRVLGGYIPAGGKIVQLQYRLPRHGAWRPFGSVLYTNRQGRWSESLPLTSAGYTYQFRALLPRQADWPYTASATRVITRSIQ